MEDPSPSAGPEIMNNNIELNETIDIKQEPQDVRLNDQQDAMVQIKIENETTAETVTTESDYLLQNALIKDEMDYDKNTTSTMETHTSESMEHVLENQTITKTENVDSDSGLKQEVVMSEDSLVSYDYPNFDDTQSMDSNDVTVLGNVETCLQEEIHIKPDIQDVSEVSMNPFFFATHFVYN